MARAGERGDALNRKPLRKERLSMANIQTDGRFNKGGNVMRLNPKEQEKLMLHMAGNLAKERKERGVKLNYVEAVLNAMRILKK